MAWVERRVAKCEVCGHEWLVSLERGRDPGQCAKCRSRKWNAEEMRTPVMLPEPARKIAPQRQQRAERPVLDTPASPIMSQPALIPGAKCYCGAGQYEFKTEMGVMKRKCVGPKPHTTNAPAKGERLL